MKQKQKRIKQIINSKTMKAIKLITMVLMVLLLGGTWTSCIKDEAPNAEADITACILPKELLLKPIDVNAAFDQELNAYPIYIHLEKNADITKLAPEFELTKGASIDPKTGSVHDFTNPVYYKVTSEDQKWTRNYALVVEQKKPDPVDPLAPSIFHLDNMKLSKGNNKGEKKYHIPYENIDGREIDWSSGNGGFAIAVSSAAPTEYPTFIEKNGVKGNCVKLVTRSTGAFGAQVKMPIAAGNLFLGKFDISNAINRPLEATKFGETWYKIPKRLKGYYQYKAGEKFMSKGEEVPGKKDQCSIYAIFYESTESTPMLDGTIQERNFKHPNMVALALLKNAVETEPGKWEYFDIEFDYKTYGKTIDKSKLADGKYHFSIVLAASNDGAKFNGAVGSTLLVDEIEVTYE